MVGANDWIVKKFKKLYELIHNDIPNSDNMPVTESEEDKLWVWDRMCDYDGGIVPVVGQLKKANLLWKKYSDKDLMIDEWEYIDQCLSEGKLIPAIKEYRNMKNCGLKEAKEVIEAREMKLKGLV